MRFLILRGDCAILEDRSKKDHLMTTVNTVELKSQANRLLKRVARHEIVLVTRRGKPCAALIPVSGDTLVDLLWEYSPETRRRLRIAEEELQEAGRRVRQEIAKERDGKCLSTEYIGSDSLLNWQCKEGHQWGARPANVKRGTWCPACAGRQSGTIEEMREIATGRGGKCLSEKYIGAYSKLTWQCKNGHQWEAMPAGVKRGRWCPTCSGKR